MSVSRQQSRLVKIRAPEIAACLPADHSAISPDQEDALVSAWRWVHPHRSNTRRVSSFVRSGRRSRCRRRLKPALCSTRVNVKRVTIFERKRRYVVHAARIGLHGQNHAPRWLNGGKLRYQRLLGTQLRLLVRSVGRADG